MPDEDRRLLASYMSCLSHSRRRFLAGFASLIGAGRFRLQNADSVRASTPDEAGRFAAARRVAERFVANESPPGVRPFEMPAEDVLRQSRRKVFIDYFPPM